MKTATLTNLAAVTAQDTRSDRRHFAERLTILAFVFDLLVTILMLLAAYGLRFETILAKWGPQEEQINLLKKYGELADQINLHNYLGHIGLGAALMMVLLVNFRVYHLNRLTSFGDAAAGIAKAGLSWLLLFMGLSLILKFSPSISRFYCVVAFVQVLIGLLTWRLFFARILRRESVAQRLRQRILLVGWNDECAKICRLLGRGVGHPFNVVGALPPSQGFGQSSPPLGVRVFQSATSIADVINEEEIDVVMASDDTASREELAALSLVCEKEMVEFKILPSCFQILLSGLHLESVNGVPVLGVSRLPLHSAFNQGLKRAIDILGALVGLILSSPFIAFFGLMVWLESRGPIFYKQVRVGRNGKRFHIFKIRSMRLDSEADGNGARWAQKGDPRCLRVGAFMRKWNIDEVPQFWNVLKGQMSLVGPRPERPELIQSFRDEIPHYNARHNIKPGITGWAQVNGLRGNTDLTERVKCDLYYIENWNLMLDFQIMAMTFFKRDNAY